MLGRAVDRIRDLTVASMPPEEQHQFMAESKQPRPDKPAKGEPKPFDHLANRNRLCDWLRAELKKWPDKNKHEAAHRIRQILEQEFSL